MIEKIKIQENPGKQYKSMNELMQDINDFKEKKSNRLNTAEFGQNIFVLRIFGKELAKFKKDNKEFWDLVDSEKPTTFVPASIHKINEKGADMNIYDFRNFNPTQKPSLIYWFSIDNNTIKNFKLQPAIKKIELKK